MKVIWDDYEGDAYVEATLRTQENKESCIPRVIVHLNKNGPSPVVPMCNLSENEFMINERG